MQKLISLSNLYKRFMKVFHALNNMSEKFDLLFSLVTLRVLSGYKNLLQVKYPHD